MIRNVEVELYDKWGQSYLEFAQFDGKQNENNHILINMEEEIRKSLNDSKYIHINTNISFREGVFQVLVEIAGTQFY